MDVEITLKNYRCFPDSRPARFRVGTGFTGLIGANHAGKSSLLRFFFEFRDLFSRLAGGNLMNALRGPLPFNFQGLTDNAESFCNLNTRDMEIGLRLLHLPQALEFVVRIPRATNQAHLSIRRNGVEFSNEVGQHDTGLYLTVGSNPEIQIGEYDDVVRVWSDLSDTIYLPAFRNAINIGSNPQYFDIQTGQAFIALWRGLKTGSSKAASEAIYQLTEDIRKLFGFRDFEINATEDGQSLQVYIGSKSYRLAEIGSGIAQFIIVLGNVAHKRPALILLDEPELNLHPSLQLDFLTTLASYSRVGIIFATHSIGLARSAAEKVYTVRRLDEGDSELRALEATPRLGEFLGELGFLGYREMGFETVLLVEGPKDLTTIQQLLRLYGKDHKIVLLSLGGSSGINGNADSQLVELRRISPNVHALIDSERSASTEPLAKDRQAFVDCCGRAGVEVHVLDRRAIENYLPEHAIQSVRGAKYRGLGPYERLGAADPSWSKEDNWRIAREMTPNDLLGTDLDALLGSL